MMKGCSGNATIMIIGLLLLIVVTAQFEEECSFEEIMERKREAVKVQLLAKLKLRTMPNQTRDDIPDDILRITSDIYHGMQGRRRGRGRQRDDFQGPPPPSPKHHLSFPDFVASSGLNAIEYRWGVAAEGANVELATLHIPLELRVPKLRIFLTAEEARVPLTHRLTEKGTVDLTDIWQSWAAEPTRNRGIQICAGRCNQESGALSNVAKPFITTDTPESRRAKRYRGSVPPQSCDNFPTSCCYKDHYLSFKELGLDHVILEPQIFNAGLCLGVCREMWLDQFYHSFVMSMADSAKVCCAPASVADLEVIYYDYPLQEPRIIVLPNMLVNECCCK